MRRPGPAYSAHSFPVSAAVTFATAPMASQKKCTGLERLLMMKLPMAPGVLGL
ncbi:hypothetical protein PICSAR254_02669 [Mycobacterium avium subsp. paratuberculosis]|nr:hypothetical protein PICSAR22_02978 [Mycobacterium avium subsp. paratuberculosis]CAG7226841.1 hypothetical protein PICSAR254_02669 [Mycobacterium avium subsp. paratuberculosis]CAG7233664.1 hypothetical protein PICSAR255_02884 [Mycobacterium avium subsp. paratuberculosis]